MRAVFAAITFLLAAPAAQAQAPTPEETAAPIATPEQTPTPNATPEERAPGVSRAIAPALGSDAQIPETWVGGYGEIHYTNVNGPEAGAEVDFHRFVFYLGHRFDDRLSFASELEIEHGGEEVELEQAYLQYAWARWLGVRGGLLLVPVGILNIHHEPPTFLGVERNTVDTIIIPTTWREAGVAAFGEPVEGFRYQVAFFNGMNAGGFGGAKGIRGGRSEASGSASNDGAIVLRLDYAPLPGLDAGASYYEGGAGRQEIEERVSLRLVEADIRFQRWGVWGRAQYARGMIAGAGALDDYLTSGTDPVAPIGRAIEGYYAEIGYDVLSAPRRTAPALGALELWPFVRYEHTNTQLDMPGSYPADDAFDRSLVTAGASFRPVPKIAIKADYQWTWTRSVDPPNVWQLGLAYMF